MNLALLSSPFLGALIGWGTNYLAIRMLFRPRRPFPLGLLTLQGVIPMRKAEFADKIGATVEQHLFSRDDVRRMLAEPEVQKLLADAVDARIESFLGGLGRSMPFVAPLLGGPMANTIRTMLRTELLTASNAIVDAVTVHLDQRLDLRAIIRQKMLDLDLDHLERIVLQVATRELRFIEVSGGVLGFLVGLVQLGVVAAIG